MDDTTTGPATDDLEERLQALEGEVSGDEASDEEALRAAIEARAEHWRQWIDELRVRADLGGKDARASLEELLARLEDAYAAFSSLSRQAAHDAGDAASDLRERSRVVVHDLDRAARTALARLKG